MRPNNSGNNYLKMFKPRGHEVKMSSAAFLQGTLASIILPHGCQPKILSSQSLKADLSGDMALRIEKAFGTKMDTLMRMQSSYNIARTRRRQNKINVPRYQPMRSRA